MKKKSIALGKRKRINERRPRSKLKSIYSKARKNIK
jgi:hypothetical protein